MKQYVGEHVKKYTHTSSRHDKHITSPHMHHIIKKALIKNEVIFCLRSIQQQLCVCMCLSVVWAHCVSVLVHTQYGKYKCKGAYVQYVGVFVLTVVLYTVKFNCHRLSKCMLSNHEKRLPTIVLTAECVCVWVQVTQ